MLHEPPAERSIASAQRLRLRRFGMAIATYAVVLLAAPLIARVDGGSVHGIHWVPFVGLAALINLVFFVLIRSGRNLRLRDPSLTQAQILASAAWGMLPLYDLPGARPLILMFYVPPFTFGMLRLNRRQYFVSVVVVIALYAGLLVFERQTGRPGFQLSYELLVLTTFAMLLGWLATFGGFVSDLRHELGRQRRAVEEANEGLGVEVAERARVAADNERLIGELQESLAQVKRLSGLLPICSSCKKIRDDAGNWRQIETYVRSHSEADFTHGICPDCSRRLYGE
jgi:hypothetical protein